MNGRTQQLSSYKEPDALDSLIIQRKKRLLESKVGILNKEQILLK
jgi:hypothetical protein